jgi:hypothetical protein
MVNHLLTEDLGTGSSRAIHNHIFLFFVKRTHRQETLGGHTHADIGRLHSSTAFFGTRYYPLSWYLIDTLSFSYTEKIVHHRYFPDRPPFYSIHLIFDTTVSIQTGYFHNIY